MQHSHGKQPLQSQSATTRFTSRRQFLSTSAKGAGAALTVSLPLSALQIIGAASAAITVGQVMDSFVADVPGAPF